MHVNAGVHRSQRCQIPLELKLQVTVSCPKWALGPPQEKYMLLTCDPSLHRVCSSDAYLISSLHKTDAPDLPQTWGTALLQTRGTALLQAWGYSSPPNLGVGRDSPQSNSSPPEPECWAKNSPLSNRSLSVPGRSITVQGKSTVRIEAMYHQILRT